MRIYEFLSEDTYIAEIKVDNKKLFLFYDCPSPGLCDLAHAGIRSNKDMYNFVRQQNAEQLAAQCIYKIGDDEYALNIASVENYGSFSFRKGEQGLLNEMLTIFCPITNQFIIWAQTGVLDKKLTSK